MALRTRSNAILMQVLARAAPRGTTQRLWFAPRARLSSRKASVRDGSSFSMNPGEARGLVCRFPPKRLSWINSALILKAWQAQQARGRGLARRQQPFFSARWELPRNVKGAAGDSTQGSHSGCRPEPWTTLGFNLNSG